MADNKRKKEKSLIPSHRGSRRYLLIENINKEKVEKAILDYVGILGYGKAAPIWVGDILGVRRESLNEIKAAFELAGIKIKRISGTIKNLGSLMPS